ncbi:MAG: YhbY family RNA-binding protein [Proteobacteria bacterium]|nr:YhbY family RNA-binding protein [Pseudomonadota bacterium]
MEKLKGFQKKYLRENAHKLKPVVIIGQKGITDHLLQSIDASLSAHELIKIKFIDYKEKQQKKDMLAIIENKEKCEVAGLVGHIAIIFRQNKNPDKRKIVLPVSK